MNFIFVFILIIAFSLSSKFRKAFLLSVRKFPILFQSTIHKYKKSPIKLFLFIIFTVFIIEFIIGIFIDSSTTIQSNFLSEILSLLIFYWLFNNVSLVLFHQKLFGLYNTNYQLFKIVVFAIISIGIVIGFNYISTPLIAYFPKFEIFEEIQNERLIVPRNNLEMFLLICNIAIIPAIIEEIMFRGLLYNIIRKKYSIMFSTFILIIVFYLFHLDLQMIPIIIVSNILLCLAYEYTKSLITPTLIHFGINLSAILVFLNNVKNT